MVKQNIREREPLSEPVALFEVHTPEGQVYRVWADGGIDGFPPGCLVMNRFQHLANERAAGVKMRLVGST